MKKLLLLAIVLRLLVSAFYFHPDIKTYHFQASFFKKGVLNIYSYLDQHKKELPLKDGFVYFPLAYISLGFYQSLVSPFLGEGLDVWLADAGVNSQVTNPNLFKYLVALKLPYLFIDIAVAYLLMEFFADPKDKKRVWTLWLFNPFTIGLIYIFGNIDIIPAALTLLSLLFVKRKKLILASVMLGLAAGFKLYPLLLLPFLVLAGKDLRQKSILLAVPTALLLAICLPFASSAFINSAVVSGLSTRIFNPGVTIGFNETIIISLFGLTIIFLWAYLFDKEIDLFKYWLSGLLIIFSFAHFHISWLVWIAPLLAILAVKKPRLRLLLIFLTILAFLIPPLYEDRSMTISLLRPYSTYFDILPTPFSILERLYDPYGLQSIFHTLLAGGSLMLLLKIFRKSES